MKTKKNTIAENSTPLRRSKRLNKKVSKQAISQRRSKKPRIEQQQQAEPIQVQQQQEPTLDPVIVDSTEDLKNTHVELQEARTTIQFMGQIQAQNVIRMNAHIKALKDLTAQIRNYLEGIHHFSFQRLAELTQQMRLLDDRMKTAETDLSRGLDIETEEIQGLRSENQQLKERITELEHSLTIANTFSVMPPILAFAADNQVVAQVPVIEQGKPISDNELDREVEKELNSTLASVSEGLGCQQGLYSEEFAAAEQDLALELEEIPSRKQLPQDKQGLCRLIDKLVDESTIDRARIAELEQHILALTTVYHEEQRQKEMEAEKLKNLYYYYNYLCDAYQHIGVTVQQPTSEQFSTIANQFMQSFRPENEAAEGQVQWKGQTGSANSSPKFSESSYLRFLASPPISSPQIEDQERAHSAAISK